MLRFDGFEYMVFIIGHIRSSSSAIDGDYKSWSSSSLHYGGISGRLELQGESILKLGPLRRKKKKGEKPRGSDLQINRGPYLSRPISLRLLSTTLIESSEFIARQDHLILGRSTNLIDVAAPNTASLFFHGLSALMEQSCAFRSLQRHNHHS